jgi:hypothetical protein
MKAIFHSMSMFGPMSIWFSLAKRAKSKHPGRIVANPEVIRPPSQFVHYRQSISRAKLLWKRCLACLQQLTQNRVNTW